MIYFVLILWSFEVLSFKCAQKLNVCILFGYFIKPTIKIKVLLGNSLRGILGIKCI
jgi:hypothetical protein